MGGSLSRDPTISSRLSRQNSYKNFETESPAMDSKFAHDEVSCRNDVLVLLVQMS